MVSVLESILAALERRRDARTGDDPPNHLPARVIARAYRIRTSGSLDSRKRGVRLLIDELRNHGHPVLADFHGYYLAKTTEDWTRYDVFLKRMGLAHLATASASRRSDARADTEGQFRLFADNPPSALVAGP